MESIELLSILIGILLVAAVSKRIRNTVITLPMLCMFLGLFVGLAFTEQVDISHEDPVVHTIAELTLMIVLAVGASRIKLSSFSRDHNLPVRLLLIGLPLTIVIGTLLGAAMFKGLEFWAVAILAVILTPADGDLAVSAIENLKVPVRIRQALNIEGGVDDGFAMPFLLLFISLAISMNVMYEREYFVLFAVKHILFGVLAGLVMGYLGAKYIDWGYRSGWMSSKFRKIGWLALVLLTFGFAEVLEGNGFVATFVFGLISGSIISKSEIDTLDEFAEAENTLLMFITYMLFGMVMLAPALKHITPPMIIYALLSLTIVRMLPVAISMIGTKLKPITVLFMGWFGPRGITSILFVLTMSGTEDIAGSEMIFGVAVTTIFFSVVAHGISAAPLAERYGVKISDLIQKGSALAEAIQVSEVPTRTRTLPVGSSPQDQPEALD
ncbi:MAG: sodium:proton antiporter [Anaerolineales bacterium]|nr:sodium:proton antiporter [Anaerolineales bacterium]